MRSNSNPTTITNHNPLLILSLPKGSNILKLASMSRRNGGPKLDLKLNLSPPRGTNRVRIDHQSPGRSASASPTSPPSSCVSSEMNPEDTLGYTNSPEATTSMLLVGCPRCLMYVMLSENDPKCPKCKSTVLLDFLHDNSAAGGGGGPDKANTFRS